MSASRITNSGRRPAARRRAGDVGIGLIEVMVALTILAVGLLAAAQMIPYAMMHTTQSQVRTNAVEVAQARLDELRSLDFDDPQLTPGVYTASQGQYNLRWAIADSMPVPGSKRIVLTASWDTVNGAMEATLSTYVAVRH
jgi:Tfp pilus assembly protein PilV